MIHKVIKTVADNKMLCPGDRVVCALSGGADSVCLLHILNSLREEMGFDLIAAHLHHGIRGEEAERDLAFSESICKGLNIPFEYSRVNVPEIASVSHEGIEECGRRLRYEFLNSVAGNSGKIATAHNLNDCMETFVMNVVRGASLSGLCGIAPVRGNTVRPLINCSRSEIEEYCREKGLEYVTDSTNLSDEYRRNSIRHKIIPKFYEYNPEFDRSFLRLVQNNRRDNEFIDSCANNALKECETPLGYSIEVLEKLHPAVLFRVLAKILEKVEISVDNKHLTELCEMVKGKGKLSLPDDFSAESNGKLLTVYKETGKKETPKYEYFFEDGKCVFKGKTVCLKPLKDENNQKIYNMLSYCVVDCDKIKGKLRIRNRHEGDKISLKHRNCTKSLKKLFNEEKIPIDERSNRIIIADNDGLVFVEGFGIDRRVAVDDQTEKSLQIIIYQ